jgi:predicted enzyme related to lactoylglutathione lyase
VAVTSSGDKGPNPTDQTGMEARLRRPGGISCRRIPSVDVQEAAAFYEKLFGWNIHGQGTDRPGFDDGTEQVGGAWVTSQAISSKPGFLPHIYVDGIDGTVERIPAHVDSRRVDI